MKISCIILAKNEDANIGKAIDSTKFCDEIIVVDDFSVDKTAQIAKKNDAEIYTKHLNNDFASQREYGISKAKNDWILFLDADEVVSKELMKEIISLQENDVVAYYIKRRDYWWGRELKYGETYQARNKGIIRLIQKGSGDWKGKVHEEFKTNKKTGQLSAFINHYPHPSVSEFLREINIYSSLRANELKTEGKSTNIFEIIFYPFAKFNYNYFLKLGFLDGPAGFAYAFFMSFHSFLVRTKLFQFTKLVKE